MRKAYTLIVAIVAASVGFSPTAFAQDKVTPLSVTAPPACVCSPWNVIGGNKEAVISIINCRCGDLACVISYMQPSSAERQITVTQQCK